MEYFKQGLAYSNAFNQIVVKNVRVSVISPKIVRVEKSDSGFIDNKTQIVSFRDFYKDKAKIELDGDLVKIVVEDRKYFIDTKNLKYKVYIKDKEVKVSKKDNLKGTIRTLDGALGALKLPDGLMSRSGLTVLKDDSVILKTDGSISTKDKNYVDFYLLAFGNDYLGGLKEFYKLSGYEPIIPKYALGNWWSRYHAYKDTEYLELMDKFKEKGIPFTVSTVDMDWHIVKNVPKDVPMVPIFGRGWTGYTFEKEYFPDYKWFLSELHKRNLKVALNLHPKDGVRYFETQYSDMAKANGIDPASKAPVEFNLLDKKFRDSYFEILHHPYEKDGVDIWWIDWQQSKKAEANGIDNLFLLNHYHYLDINREKPGIILSRFSGIGSQRYPLGFSGDTIVSWKSLRFQPYFTATSANVGYTWWSHDIGGHMYSMGKEELYLRWLQLGCFLPINRLHSTCMGISKEPWLYPGVEKEAIKILRLRHSLIAYLYSASLLNHREGIPIVAPLYYFYKDDTAYSRKYRNQYIFASNLLVCPVTKAKGLDKISKLKVWFPEGNWINIFNGKKYVGNTEVSIECPLNEYPVFIKEGDFLPMLKSEYNEINDGNLLVKVSLGNGKYELFDDNGSIKFECRYENDGYRIIVVKEGDIKTTNIEFEFLGENIDNINVKLDKKVDFLIKRE